MVVAETVIDPADAIRPQVDTLVEVARRLRLSRGDVADAIERAWGIPEEEA